MLRAFVDESGSAGRDGIFVMGGLVAFASKWDEFIEPWDAALRADVAAPFFRTASFRSLDWRTAHGLSIDDANRKTEALARTITYPPILFSVCCSAQKKDYRDIVVNSGAPRKAGRLGKLWLKTAYAYCFHNVISLTLEMIVNKLCISGDVVDFVFDRNDPLFDAANKMLRELRKCLKILEWSKTLGVAIPGDDEKILPLQAADLLAGRLKDHCSSPKDVEIRKSLLSVSSEEEDKNITLHITRMSPQKRSPCPVSGTDLMPADSRPVPGPVYPES